MKRIRNICSIVLILIVLTSCNSEKEYEDEWSEQYRRDYIEKHMEIIS